MNYNIRVVPQDAQRYDTVGDYYQKHTQMTEVRISDFTPAVIRLLHSSEKAVAATEEDIKLAEDFEFLVMIHELIEHHLCRRRGISIEAIDEFDFAFKGDGEPGESEDAPYHDEHIFAESVEKTLAAALNISWEKYTAAVEALFPEQQKEES